MQDDLLIEKPSKPVDVLDDKTKDLLDPEAQASSSPSSVDKDLQGNPLHSFVSEQVRVPSLWSDDSLHSMPVNGSSSLAAFQNFPSGQGGQGLFSSNSAGNRRAITASHNFPQQQANARHQLGQQQQSSQHPGVYLQSKGYAAWSGGPPQQQWSQQAQTQSPWNRGRSVPNLPPLHPSLQAAAAAAAAALQGRKPSPTFANAGHHAGPAGAGHQSSISPVKFRRSTSYPGKGYPPQAPSFEVTQPDERDLLQLPGYQQVRMNFI